MDKELLDKILNKELITTKKMLTYDPYTIIASDNEYIRDYFVKGLADSVIVMKDYNLYYPEYEVIHKNLRQNHILLLNFEEKVKEYSKHYKDKFDKPWHAIYYSLIPYRDLFRKNDMHTIVIVCDNKTAYGALRDANLGSATYTCFLDRQLERNEIFYKDILEQVEEEKNNNLSNN